MGLLSGEYQPSTRDWVRKQVELYESTGGQEGNASRARPEVPVVVITSVGAKSCKLRKNPVIRIEYDGKYAAIASMGGSAKHPNWYWNFQANPVVEVQDGPKTRLFRARLVDGAERREWWERAVAVYGPYADYQVKSDQSGRQIPVFLLEPVEGHDSVSPGLDGPT